MASIMPKGFFQLLLKGLYFLIDANLMVINQYCATKILPTGMGAFKNCGSYKWLVEDTNHSSASAGVHHRPKLGATILNTPTGLGHQLFVLLLVFVSFITTLSK